MALVDLGPGDCFDGLDPVPAEGASATQVVRIPCGEPHDHEVFHAFEFGDDEQYSGEKETMQLAQESCRDAFVLGVGNADALDQISIWPTADSWAADDRTVLCAAFARDGDQLVGNIR